MSGPLSEGLGQLEACLPWTSRGLFSIKSVIAFVSVSVTECSLSSFLISIQVSTVQTQQVLNFGLHLALKAQIRGPGSSISDPLHAHNTAGLLKIE